MKFILPRLQNKYSPLHSGCNRGKHWGQNGRFGGRDCKKSARRSTLGAIAANRQAAWSRNITLEMAGCLPNVYQVKKNTPSSVLEGVSGCLGRESNPHGRFGPRDFRTTMAFATISVCGLDYSFTVEPGSLGVSCLVSAPSSFQRLGSRLPSALPVMVSLNLRHSTSLFSESALKCALPR